MSLYPIPLFCSSNFTPYVCVFTESDMLIAKYYNQIKNIIVFYKNALQILKHVVKFKCQLLEVDVIFYRPDITER